MAKPTEFQAGNYTCVMFQAEIQSLNAEVAYHPKLMEKLAKQHMDEWEIKLAAIALHVGVILDATYTPEDVLGICELCTKKLRAMRGADSPLIILPEHFGTLKH